MSYFVVDVEADGPCPGLYSMISFGAVKVQEDLKNTPTFYGQLKPISDNWNSKSLSISGFSREETIKFPEPYDVIKKFDEWLSENSENRLIFISDNNCFDWMFINYYFHAYLGYNPFGFSSRRIGDLYCGMQRDTFAKWKHLRKTKHTHHPVTDSMGNAEVILKMKKMGLNIKL